MSVRVTVTVVVEDGISIEDLKQWVVDEDLALSGEGNGVAIENVTPEHILQELFAGSIKYEVVNEELCE